LQLPFVISSDRLTYYVSGNGGRDGGTVKVADADADADADAVIRGGEVRRREGKEERRRQVRRVGEERKNEEVMRGGKEREEKRRRGVVW
jgi:hypothetical protein